MEWIFFLLAQEKPLFLWLPFASSRRYRTVGGRRVVVRTRWGLFHRKRERTRSLSTAREGASFGPLLFDEEQKKKSKKNARPPLWASHH